MGVKYFIVGGPENPECDVSRYNELENSLLIKLEVYPYL
jgi:hypothetical protein